MSPARLAVFDQRRTGVLLHPTALPGGLGAAARHFIDWLAAGGFSVWQVLPLGPVGPDLSPYWSRADGAINPALIDWSEAPSTEERAADFAAFRREQAGWLDDYALFEALAASAAGRPWWQWPPRLRDRDASGLALARERLSPAIERICREQWVASLQWRGVREHARERGVRLFGDLPIYAAPDSATVWSQRAQFQLDHAGLPRAVAGVPPDYFSADGQLWGNPLYDWDQAQRDGFAFWRRRMAGTLAHFDVVRIDHFRGLCDYWSVPAGAHTAREGHWEPAPGAAMLRALHGDFPDLPLVAEDLGVITDEVTALRSDFRLPGMRVMQFGFDGQGNNPHLPHQYERDTVAYSGTHDNDTTLGWYRSLDAATRWRVHQYLRAGGPDMPEALLRALLNSVAPLAMLPLQDLLALGSEARFNTPGTLGGNWTWRLADGALSHELAMHWRGLNEVCGRSGRP